MLKIDRAKLDRLLSLAALNYSELARAAGLKPTTISNLINGKTTPRPGTVRKITEVLGCKPADILEEVQP